MRGRAGEAACGFSRGLTWSTHNDMLPPPPPAAAAAASVCGDGRRPRARMRSDCRSEEKNELTDRLKWSSRRRLRRRPRSHRIRPHWTLGGGGNSAEE